MISLTAIQALIAQVPQDSTESFESPVGQLNGGSGQRQHTLRPHWSSPRRADRLDFAERTMTHPRSACRLTTKLHHGLA